MNKRELIDIVDTIVDARIKKILPRILKEETNKIRKEMHEEFEREVIAELKSFNPKTKLQAKIDSSENDEIQMPEISDILDVGNDDDEEDHSAKPQKIEKSFSNNPAVNRIMNDMMQSKKQISDGDKKLIMDDYRKSLQEQYDDVETFSFDTKNIASIANRTAMIPQGKSQSIPKEVGQEILKNQITAESGNPAIANAMIKDYRSILKQMDEEAKSIRSKPIGSI